MSIVAVTDHAIVYDCQAALSQGLLVSLSKQWHLRSNDFDVSEPYFRTSQHPNKKRKAVPLNLADADTDKRHQDIRSFLLSCIEEVQCVWPIAKASTEQDAPADTASLTDFTSLVGIAQAAARFALNKDIVELSDDNTLLETLDVFNTIITNPSDSFCKTILVDQRNYIIPPRASFLMGDIDDMPSTLSTFADSLEGFHLVVMDPPWPNKSVHRSSHYDTQDIYDLFQIPMPTLLAKEGAMVAVWVTNKPKFRKFVIDKLFPSWQLKCVGEWHWLKMTTQGDLVMPLDSPHRKPYEQLIIGCCGPSMTIPYTKAIVSVPSKRHSRKPPLHDILTPYLPTKPRCLELFARCLTPGWTSWGNECLKFQDEHYFVLSDKEDKEKPKVSTPAEPPSNDKIEG